MVITTVTVHGGRSFDYTRGPNTSSHRTQLEAQTTAWNDHMGCCSGVLSARTVRPVRLHAGASQDREGTVRRGLDVDTDSDSSLP